MSVRVKKVSPDNIDLQNFILEHLTQNPDEAFTNHLKKLLSDDRSYLFAALSGEEIIGYTLAYSFPSLYAVEYLAYLYDIEVLEKHRRKGAGKLLMQTLLEHLTQEGITELWLGTATDNLEAQALFTATGGERSGETFNDFTWEF